MSLCAAIVALFCPSIMLLADWNKTEGGGGGAHMLHCHQHCHRQHHHLHHLFLLIIIIIIIIIILLPSAPNAHHCPYPEDRLSVSLRWVELIPLGPAKHRVVSARRFRFVLNEGNRDQDVDHEQHQAL
eukprot:COSAG05_NODE_2413_length_3094_cov_4.279800_2_plen_128_part_00